MLRPIAIAVLVLALAPGAARASNCNGWQTGLVPITALGAGTYQGYPGGLYPGGSNQRPPAYEEAGLVIANAIAPLDTFGNPDANGRVVFISIGMSNATQEFSTFVPMANADPYRDPRVLVVDCAVGGQTASIIKDPAAPYWTTVRSRLSARGSSLAQVQVAWIKEANAGPTSGFPAATVTLMRDLGSVVRTLKDLLPNVRIAYLSSRIYAGYASTALNPEPYAYESGFAVKWLIEAQISGEDSLEFDPGQGPVEAPWLSWGPYLWADGLNPRPGDGLTWSCGDFATDGTHPAAGGRLKVADMLFQFVHIDPTVQPWYLSYTVGAPASAARAGPALALTPNPARGVVALTIATVAGEPWRLEVLDLAGRRVRELGRGVGDGTARSLRWDPSGDGARTGLYWVRLTAGGRATVRKLAILAGS